MADYDMGAIPVDNLIIEAGMDYPNETVKDASELNCLGTTSGGGGGSGGSSTWYGRTVPRLRRAKP